MGNKNSAGELHNEAKLAASKFESTELHILKKTWEVLADRNDGRGIDKEMFLQYFPLSGLLGERLFTEFNMKGNGLIDFDEFVIGLAVCSRGTMDDKIHFIFNMYDTSHDNTVSKDELTTLLNQVPTDVFNMEGMNVKISESVDEEATQCEKFGNLGVQTPPPSKSEEYEDLNEENDDCRNSSSSSASSNSFDSVKYYTNHDIVEKAFDECGLNHEGRLKYEEFKMWVLRTPAILEYFESVLPFVGDKDECNAHENKKKEALPMTQCARLTSLRRDALLRNSSKSFQSTASINSARSSATLGDKQSVASCTPTTASNTPDFYVFDTVTPSTSPPLDIAGGHEDDDKEVEEQVKELVYQALELTRSTSIRNSLQDVIDAHYNGNISVPHNDSQIYKEVVTKEGYLWKQGNRLHFWNKRWYLMSGSCMYYYLNETDFRPKGVVFLAGCLVDKLIDKSSELKGYYGIEVLQQDLCTGEHHKHDRRVFYCKSESERDAWLKEMQLAAHVVPVESDYVIGKVLGHGRFSTVCECVHISTSVHYAVKIIEKSKLEQEEKEFLRTEIAILKLVNHPNIIKMQGIYESRTHMYIVMEKLSGGELYGNIVNRPLFDEDEAAKLIRPLLESVAYLHDLGIVHRDIKPENILCGESLEDVKIADFGLSKMILPEEKMDVACGTLSYVAPEVLTKKGYGNEADLWSIGVITFLILCGKLPFDGEDVIKATIHGDIRVSPKVWKALTVEAQGFIKGLLHRNPKERLSAKAALRHPFMLEHCPHKHHHNHVRQNSKKNMLKSESPNVPS